MPRKKVYKVTPIKNAKGEVISYEAQGNVRGKTFRRRFDDEEKAYAQIEIWRTLDQNAMNLRKPAMTTLTDPEIADAEAAYSEVRKKIPDKSLSWIVHEYLREYDGEIVEIKVADASKKFLETRAKGKKKANRERQVTDHERMQARIVERFGDKFVCRVSTADLKALMESRKIESPKTHNNVVSLISTFFTWCCEKRYLSPKLSPLNDEFFRTKNTDEPLREILSPKDSAKVMEFAETWKDGVMVNYIATSLFAGVRPDSPGEVSRLGAQHQERNLIKLEERCISIPSDIAKGRRSRDITIQDALLAFYTAYPLSEYPILPVIPATSNYSSRFAYAKELKEQFWKACPVRIPHDALRHSFASYHLKLSGSFSDTVLESGNTEEMLRIHYVRKTTYDKAIQFWAIRPNHSRALAA